MYKYTPSGEYSLIGISLNVAQNQCVKLIMGVGKCVCSPAANRENLIPPGNMDKISKTMSIPELKSVFREILSDFDLNFAKVRDFADTFNGLRFKAKIDHNGKITKTWIEPPHKNESPEESEYLRSLL